MADKKILNYNPKVCAIVWNSTTVLNSMNNSWNSLGAYLLRGRSMFRRELNVVIPHTSSRARSMHFEGSKSGNQMKKFMKTSMLSGILFV